jgi:hypothetical protein
MPTAIGISCTFVPVNKRCFVDGSEHARNPCAIGNVDAVDGQKTEITGGAGEKCFASPKNWTPYRFMTLEPLFGAQNANQSRAVFKFDCAIARIWHPRLAVTLLIV